MNPKDAPNASAEQVLKEVLDFVMLMKEGYFTMHLHETFPGAGGEIARVLNQHVLQMQALRKEHLRIMEEIGVTGRLGGQAEVPELTGAWKEIVDATNRAGW